jgi:hypothetical protein
VLIFHFHGLLQYSWLQLPSALRPPHTYAELHVMYITRVSCCWYTSLCAGCTGVGISRSVFVQHRLGAPVDDRWCAQLHTLPSSCICWSVHSQLLLVDFVNRMAVWHCQSSDCASSPAGGSLLYDILVSGPKQGGYHAQLWSQYCYLGTNTMFFCLTWYISRSQISFTHNCYMDFHGAAYHLPCIYT